MNLPPDQELLRRQAWYNYFLALRQKQTELANHHRRIALLYEKKRKFYIAEQLPLL